MTLLGDPEARRVHAIDLDGLAASPVLDLVPYLTADEIGRGISKPELGDVVEVEVLVGDEAGLGGVHVVLGVHPTAFAGRRWVARCPTCGSSARLLRFVSDGVRCSRCVGLPRWSERHGHKFWYKDLVRPLRQAARLRQRAYRCPGGAPSRRCLHRAARRMLAEAAVGAARLLLVADAAAGSAWKQPDRSAFSPRSARLTMRAEGPMP